MREDPLHDAVLIATSLVENYGVQAESITFLPLGNDFDAAVYDVKAMDGRHYFLKVRTNEIAEASLQIPHALTELGVPNILSPLRTRSDNLWCRLNDEALVILYPFVRGQNAKQVGLTDDQWRTFGAALRAVHESGLHERFHDQIRRETFALPSAALVRRMVAVPESVRVESPAAEEFGRFWDERAQQIEEMVKRAEEIGRQLQRQTFPSVLCHSDIHAANILVGEDSRIWLVDWDDPIIAPRERDLLFIVGSRIARTVEPRHEDLFFEGYGPTTVDPLALVYYRYERIIEDIGVDARHILLDDEAGEKARAAEAALVMHLFAPGEDVDRVESVARTQWR